MRRAYDLLRGYINREWERIQGVERDYAEHELNEALKSPVPQRTPEETRQQETEDRDDRARKILGVGPSASFDEIRKAYERLNKRSDPGNFPRDSDEQIHARDINRRVQWAYQVLSESVDVTEKRFRSLELE